jgi:hypothetical protein
MTEESRKSCYVLLQTCCYATWVAGKPNYFHTLNEKMSVAIISNLV